MKLNPEMVVLARQLRGMKQHDLSRALGVGQARISKLEGGLQPDLPDGLCELMAETLKVPLAFFVQEGELIGVGSSAYFYRKKAELSATDRDRIHALVNLFRLHLKRLLLSVEIEGTRKLPVLSIDDYGGSAANVARAVRSFWVLPNGPIRNVTSLLESAGIVIIPCQFGTRAMDATSMRLGEMPPIIFINCDIPTDRWRFTLCHELAHLIMHEVPHELIEDQADAFASEFLMPEQEVRPQFQRMQPLRLQDLANLKPFWRVSIGALLMRASALNEISQTQRTKLWARMAQLGWRTDEPAPLPKETPGTLAKITSYFAHDMSYSNQELAQLLRINLDDLQSLYGDVSAADGPQRRASLRVV